MVDDDNTKEPVKRNLSSSPFMILSKPSDQFRETIEHLGGSGLTADDLTRIKMPTGGRTIWDLPGLGGGEPRREFHGLILAMHDTRALWNPAAELSGSSRPPDCSSPDARFGFGTPSGECGRCPKAQFGSGPGGEGQACKLTRQVFVLRPENLLPEILLVPPSSLKVVKKFVVELLTANIPVCAVPTRFGLERTTNARGIAYSKLVLTSDGQLTPEQLQIIKDYIVAIAPLLKAPDSVPRVNDVAEPGDEEVL